MKTLLLILVLSVAGVAQNLDPTRFEAVAIDSLIKYFVNVVDAKRRGQIVTFDTLGAHYETFAGGLGFAFDKDHYVIMRFKANCQTFTATKLSDRGIWNGKAVIEDYKKPMRKVAKGRNLYLAIERVCRK